MPPPVSKPNSLEEYVEWARVNLTVNHDEGVRRWYTANATAALNAANDHPFVKDLAVVLQQAGHDYHLRFNATLMMSGPPQLQVKPYESVLLKSFRQNVLSNRSFPQEPRGGWVIPDNWFSRINDIVRGTVVTKYLDGPPFLVDVISQHASSKGLQPRSAVPYTDTGYYAHHLYSKIPIEITKPDWTGEAVDLSLELQITTQLQEVLRHLTHQFYAAERVLPARPDWTWEFETDAFKAKYLGHTLHMLEGIIVELRNRNTASRPESEE